MTANDEDGTYKTFGKRRSLRMLGHHYSESRAYHITWGTHQRRKLLVSNAVASEVCRILEEEATRAPTDLYAYCVMPDHVHVLLQPNGGDLIQYVQAVKGKTTRAYWKLGRSSKLWQRGFHDHILRREESLHVIAQYILANPVRAGLTDDIVAYPFSGSTMFKIEEL
ncbi:transposase [Candidatus Bipolaricaulota bacterium]